MGCIAILPLSGVKSSGHACPSRRTDPPRPTRGRHSRDNHPRHPFLRRDDATDTAHESAKMSSHSLFRSLGRKSPVATGVFTIVHRSRKPVTGFSPNEGSNPSLSVCLFSRFASWRSQANSRFSRPRASDLDRPAEVNAGHPAPPRQASAISLPFPRPHEPMPPVAGDADAPGRRKLA